MRINKKILIPVILIICMVWGYNILIFMVSRIEEPIFLNQYSDSIEYSEEDKYGVVNIEYLEDKYSEDRILNVQFPELGGELIPVNINYEYGEDRNILNKKIEIQLSEIESYLNISIADLLEKGDLKITNMTYETSSGKRENVDLGEIIISKKFKYDKKYPILGSSKLYNSNEDSGTVSTFTKDDLKIVDIEGKNLETIKRLFNVYINGNKLEDIEFPISVGRGRVIEVYYKVKEELSKKNFDVEKYDMNLKVKCSDPEGTIDYITVNLKPEIYSIKDITNNIFIKKIKNIWEVK